MLPALGLLGAIVVAVIFLAIGVYNGLVGLREKVNEAWSGVETFLKKRYDMIPNLIETVKGYAKHEEGVFTKVTELRTRAMGASNPKEQIAAENALTGTLKTLFAVAENYPDLKANQNFMQFQADYTELEDELNKARRYYNAVVRDYNTKRLVFPNVLLAGLLGFGERDYFELDNEEEKESPKVQF